MWFGLFVSFAVIPNAVAVDGDLGEKKAAVAFLCTLRQADGGYVAQRSITAKNGSTILATSAAVRSIQLLDGKPPEPEKTLAFVHSCIVDDAGGIANSPGGEASVVTTAIGLVLMSNLNRSANPDKHLRYLARNARSFQERRIAVAGMEAVGKFDPVIDDWFAEIAKTANADGTFGEGHGQARATGEIAAMMLRSGRKLNERQRTAIEHALLQSQRPDGGFGSDASGKSDMETTYRVARALHLLKTEPRDCRKLHDFLTQHCNPDGGASLVPGGPSSASGTYHVAIIRHWFFRQ